MNDIPLKVCPCQITPFKITVLEILLRNQRVRVCIIFKMIINGDALVKMSPKRG